MRPKHRSRSVSTPHKQFRVAHAVDQLGRPSGSHCLAATPAGYRDCSDWSLPATNAARAGQERLVSCCAERFGNTFGNETPRDGMRLGTTR